MADVHPDYTEIRIPKDAKKRAEYLAQFAMTAEERTAIERWCYLMAEEDAAARRRGLERVGEEPMP